MTCSLFTCVRVRLGHRLALSLLALTAAVCWAPSSAGQAPAAAKPAAESPVSAEQLQAGKSLFAAQCGFCHGRDAGGGESGPDLMESAIVAQDVQGDKIGPV